MNILIIKYIKTIDRDAFKSIINFFLKCGRSSGVERNLAKVEVEGSNPFARSNDIIYF